MEDVIETIVAQPKLYQQWNVLRNFGFDSHRRKKHNPQDRISFSMKKETFDKSESNLY